MSLHLWEMRRIELRMLPLNRVDGDAPAQSIMIMSPGATRSVCTNRNVSARGEWAHSRCEAHRQRRKVKSFARADSAVRGRACCQECVEQSPLCSSQVVPVAADGG